ncbi:MAG: HU family DNA-binding protein [Parabacteroides sp.]|uniref:HU family DNA-binding protein n=1 Tax=Macellibacteroides fermentans TaxID=879969 RepID=UPI001B58D84F|nr:HU family DNA-binding protein [Parabacteroides sp.]HML71914.1 HU family DNA-binding protein [Macellibacteroides fermentans]
MNNKLTIQELATLLSVKSGKDVYETERFIREFITVVSEGLFSDKMVKVKGLGTFKIVLVEDRESIHVNTGERILIPAHYKCSFLPDNELKELVNRPFSIFETTEIGDAASFQDMEMADDSDEDDVDSDLESDANEDGEDLSLPKSSVTESRINGLLDKEMTEELADPEDLPEIHSPEEALTVDKQPNGQIDTVDSPVSDDSPEEVSEPYNEETIEMENPKEEDTIDVEDSIHMDETLSEEIDESPEADLASEVVDTIPDSQANELTPEIESSSQIDNQDKEKEQTENREEIIRAKLASLSAKDPVAFVAPEAKPKKRRKHGHTATKTFFYIIVGGLLVTASVALFFYFQSLEVRNAVPIMIESVSAIPTETPAPTDSVFDESDSIPSNEKDSVPEVVSEPQGTMQTEQVKTKYMDTVVIQTGDRLTLISLKYYGHKIFWVYLYLANKESIPNPNSVAIGTQIHIPVPETYNIDANDEQSIRKAAALQTEILKE